MHKLVVLGLVATLVGCTPPHTPEQIEKFKAKCEQIGGKFSIQQAGSGRTWLSCSKEYNGKTIIWRGNELDGNTVMPPLRL